MNIELPESGASGVPPAGPDGPSETAPAVEPQPAPTVPKNRGGAPYGMRNGSAVHLLESKASAREQRDKHRRAAERELRDTLKAAGLAGNAYATQHAKSLVPLLAALKRCEARVETRGAFDVKGQPLPAFAKSIEIANRLADEFRKLLDMTGGAERATPDNTPRGGLVCTSLARLRSGEDCPTCGRPVAGTVLLVEPAPMITAAEVRAAVPCLDDDSDPKRWTGQHPALIRVSIAEEVTLDAIDAPLDDAQPLEPKAQPRHRVLEQSAAPTPVQSNAPASPPEPARRLAPGVTLTPGPHRSIDQMLMDAGLGPRKSSGGGPTW